MAKLFIIGNGFDLHHHLKTSYLDFRSFLLSEIGKVDDKKLTFYRRKFRFAIPEISPVPMQSRSVDPEELAAFYVVAVEDYAGNDRSIDPWNVFESRLGEIDLLPQQKMSMDCFGKEWKQAGQDDFWDNCIKTFGPLSSFFEEWVNQIDLKAAIPDPSFEALIDPRQDLFFTFNYTETLESLYHAQHVLHIHGKRGHEVIFGHGRTTEEMTRYRQAKEESNLQKQSFYDSLKKNTGVCIKEYQSFFQNLHGQVDAIYSCGFSFSDVDMPYMREILKNLDTRNLVWYLDETYDTKESIRAVEQKILSLTGEQGDPLFQGTFDTFRLLGIPGQKPESGQRNPLFST